MFDFPLGIAKFLTPLWSWWEHRYGVKSQLGTYCRRIETTNDNTALSAILVEVQVFLLAHGGLLGRPEVKQLYETWCMDESLDREGIHSRLKDSGPSIARLKNIARLKRDAALLTR